MFTQYQHLRHWAGGLWGFEIASVSGIIGTEQYQNYFGNPLGTRQGVITSSMAGGSLVGALSSSFLGDRLSRKITMQIGAVLWCIGTVIQSASNGVPMLIVGRVIAGLCIGLTSALAPIYQSEIAPRKIRGRVVVFQYFAITCGITVQYFIEYGCSFLDSTASFRLPWAIQIIPAVVFFVGLFWFPYSPRWLASVDRWDEALRVLALLRTANGDTNNPLVIAEYKEIEDQIRCEREEHYNSYRELISPKMHALIVYILQSAGVANLRLASSMQYVINMIMTIPPMIWIDKWGRRPALLLGAPILSFWLVILGGLFKQYGEPNPATDQPNTWIIVGHRSASLAILACLYLGVATFALTWGPVALMYAPEIVPLRIRAKSVSLATASDWAANCALGLSVPPLLRSLRWRVFFIFGTFNILAFIQVWFTAPETKKRTLEEMDEVFEHGKPLWKSFFDRRESDKLEMLARDIENERLRESTRAHVATTGYPIMDSGLHI
ncbi:hypothetical protein V1506DRAFT_563433 [Lipomyces tetrasporus]